MPIVTPRGHHLGYIADLPDQRDLTFAPAPIITRTQPPAIDLRQRMPPVDDQEQCGSCMPQAASCAYRCATPHITWTPSRLFIYLEARRIEHSIESDSGCQPRDALKALARLGVPPEASWPYDITKFADTPPHTVYDQAIHHRLLEYRSVARDLVHLRACLTEGFPFIVGLSIYDSFESDATNRTGVIAMPQPSESLLGGHATVIVGYDDDLQMWILRNSWGLVWGDHGYGYLPYAYLLSNGLSRDFWTLRRIQAPVGGGVVA